VHSRIASEMLPNPKEKRKEWQIAFSERELLPRTGWSLKWACPVIPIKLGQYQFSRRATKELLTVMQTCRAPFDFVGTRELKARPQQNRNSDQCNVTKFTT